MAEQVLNEIAVVNQVLQGNVKHKEAAEEIRLLHSSCLELSQRAKAEAQGALTGALRAGTLLIEVKEQLPHGEWTPWLREYLPEISHSTINRYMRVARRFRESGSQNFGSTLVDAYRGAGILPTKKRVVNAKPSDGAAESAPVDAVRKSISSLGRALRKWKRDQKRKEVPSELNESTRSDLKRLRDEIDGLLSERG